MRELKMPEIVTVSGGESRQDTIVVEASYLGGSGGFSGGFGIWGPKTGSSIFDFFKGIPAAWEDAKDPDNSVITIGTGDIECCSVDIRGDIGVSVGLLNFDTSAFLKQLEKFMLEDKVIR